MDYTTYLYAVKAGGSTDPNDLSAGARNYQAIYGMEWRASLFLTCRWAMSVGEVAACDPQALETAGHCYALCIPGYALNALRVYLLCQIAVGGGGGVDIPTGFTWAEDGVYIATTSTWAAPPAGVTATELWTSQDNVTYVLTDVIAAPTAAWYATTILNSPSYAKIRFLNGTTPGAFCTPVSFSLANNWAARVVANGGAAPSAGTKTALDVFGNTLATGTLIDNFYAINAMVPDSLIAGLTPFLCPVGPQLWINNGFVLANLTVNGFQGTGAAYMDTGITVPLIAIAPPGKISVSPTDSFGIDFYDSLSTGSNTIEVGMEGATVDQSISLLAQFGATCFWDCPYAAGTGRVQYNPTTGQRLIMGNRAAGNSQQIYDYDSVNGFNLRVSNFMNLSGSPLETVSWYVFASHRTAGLLISDKRGSYCAFRQGFSVGQATQYALAVQALRVALGGGFA